MMADKKRLGQFFTTNSGRILRGFEGYARGKNVADPFAGNGDLLAWAEKHGAARAQGYDIDPRLCDGTRIHLGDSLREVRPYGFVLTNPPYLYQNKMADNSLLKAGKHTDLYQLALEKLLRAEEGIIIVPINFISAENAKYIRALFLNQFNIIKANYFTNQAFEDTSYNVIAFYFCRKSAPSDIMSIDFTFYPQGRETKITLEKRYNWQIGGDFVAKIKAQKNILGIKRLEEEHLETGGCGLTLAYNHIKNKRNFQVSKALYARLQNNIVLLKAIDTGKNAAEGRICLEDVRKYQCSGLVSIKTSRNQISLLFPPHITVAEQERLITLFNAELARKRAQYYSLFMTNYRDKDRKRISFNFAYKLINYLYNRGAFSSRSKNHAASAKHRLFEPVPR